MPNLSSISNFGSFSDQEPMREKKEETRTEKTDGLKGAIGSVEETKLDETASVKRPSAVADSTAEPEKDFLPNAIDSIRSTSRKSTDGTVTTKDILRAGKSITHQEPDVSDAQIRSSKVHHIKTDLLPWIKNIFEAGTRGNDYVVEKFEKVIESIEGLTEEDKSKYLSSANSLKKENIQKLEDVKKEVLEKDEWSEKSDTLITPNKTLDNSRANSAEEFRGKVCENIASLGDTIVDGILQTKSHELPFEGTAKLQGFRRDILDQAADIEGAKRYEIIHEDSMWDPEEVCVRNMAFEDVKVTSTFHAAGPGVSSMAPRNRTSEAAYVANFFETGMTIKKAGESEEPRTLIDGVTRSAITVEFDQKDEKERIQANVKLNRQVLDAQVKHKLEATPSEDLLDAVDENKPIILTSQTVNLLTTDKMRSALSRHSRFAKLGKKIHEGLSGAPADDERSLALENLAAHKQLNDKTVPYVVRDSAGGEMKIHVKYDLRYFNVGNNILQEKMPERLTSCREIEEANNASWKKLEGDVLKQIDELDKLTGNIVDNGINDEKKLSDKEKTWVAAFNKASAAKSDARQRVAKGTIKKKSLDASDPQFKKWQETADALAEQMVEMLKNDDNSSAMKEILQHLEMRENLRDLFIDTNELYASGLWKDPKNMDNNRSALATRIIALGVLVKDLQVHFGCRSGKDRTGLVDIELKLLFTEAFLNHRMPSYREEEKLQDIADHRERMTLESGNVFDIIRATMGASIGLNIVGSATKPLNEKDPRGKQHLQTIERSQAGQRMARRPKTNLPILPGYLDKWKENEIIVKYAENA